MRLELIYIKPHSVAKMIAILTAFFTLAYFTIFMFVPALMNQGGSALIGFFQSHGILRWISSALLKIISTYVMAFGCCLLFNYVAKRFGGIDIEVTDKTNDAT